MNILQRYFTGDSKIPVLIVGNKSDKGTPVRQDFSLQPEAFCARYKVNRHSFNICRYAIILL